MLESLYWTKNCNLLTYINVGFLSNIPILGWHTRPPFKINRESYLGIVICTPKTYNVVTSLHCLKCKLPWLNMISKVTQFPTRRNQLTINNKSNHISTQKFKFTTPIFKHINWTKEFRIFGTRTMSLCDSGKGWPSLGLAML